MAANSEQLAAAPSTTGGLEELEPEEFETVYSRKQSEGTIGRNVDDRGSISRQARLSNESSENSANSTYQTKGELRKSAAQIRKDVVDIIRKSTGSDVGFNLHPDDQEENEDQNIPPEVSPSRELSSKGFDGSYSSKRNHSAEADDLSEEEFTNQSMELTDIIELELAGEFENEEEALDRLRSSLISTTARESRKSSGGARFTEPTQLTVFESLALSSILEEMYLQLEILGSSFPGSLIQPEKMDFLTYDERFSQEVDEKEVEYMPRLKNFKNPFVIDETQIGTREERQASKLQKDRAFLQELVRLTKEEIDQFRAFNTLIENVARESGRRNEEITLLQREKNALFAVSAMRTKITAFQKDNKQEEDKRLEMINHLKDQLHEAKEQGKQDARYTRSWYEARNEFNYNELSHQTDLAKLRIKALEVDMTRDKLAHQNIEAWYLLNFEEIQANILHWKNKMDEDLEVIDRQIREQNDLIRDQQSMMEGLRNTIGERMIQLAPWEEEKQAERMAKANNLRVHNAAKKIQRWWRQYMTTHNLYKKKKPKGGKPKGKGKRG